MKVRQAGSATVSDHGGGNGPETSPGRYETCYESADGQALQCNAGGGQRRAVWLVAKRHSDDARAHGGLVDLMRHAAELCAAQGLQWTPLRRRVFGSLVESGRPLGAYDLVERLGTEKRIAPISVYRALDFLIEVGLIHRIATRNTYLPCHHDNGQHDATVFLVCTRCGSVDEVASPEIARGIDGTTAAAGFRTDNRFVEIGGECQACQHAS